MEEQVMKAGKEKLYKGPFMADRRSRAIIPEHWREAGHDGNY